ncbi:formate dehydrogenase accessory sulfurtransferase FdhD [Corynebacterium lizhenjunii]|uniref:Sulfur carrier protein FdhD n=1 Tax=Corynebacterium lizhenjunii TaxID=2709394 RepID=A0A7T0KEZ3_9CORY|nr:formate dehydrogenase accessory sulfurtransferase FdhD [Corynebacterium lizhenjunii]QPK79568.1 formate dehydrogenase accessory sulfurtransferase FdhD [Corynebacterium lizhenjunii]
MAGRVNSTYAVTKIRRGSHGQLVADTRADVVAGEEPLEIRVGGQTLTTTMRTPGHDIELAHGFLHSEGHIVSSSDVLEARYCAGSVTSGPSGMAENTYNLLDVELRDPHALNLTDLRLTLTSSACGVCGTASIEQLHKRTRYPLPDVPVDPELIAQLPASLREHQKQFRKTGGIHAAGAFDFAGNPVVVREDVGRHNAADKVIGHLLLQNRLPAKDLILVLSSRASFELVQKAAMAGIGTLVAVSAASSLAVETARQTGLTLIGFARGDTFNLYSGRLAD